MNKEVERASGTGAPERLEWTGVGKDTYRAVVEGGWLYRHDLMYRTNPSVVRTGPDEVRCASAMVFVPDAGLSRKAPKKGRA